jgi:hypothetical protein
VDKQNATCPGCGLILESDSTDLDEKFNASKACRALYFDLTYYTLSLGDQYFIHQLAVDAYAASHSGENVKAISTTFAIIGLYLVWDRGFTGRQVQQAHIQLAQKNKFWPRISIPREKSAVRVIDVVTVPDMEKQDMIKKWSKSVWEIWMPEKENIASMLAHYAIL